nr:MAG TPA: hypothetical protein [Caudoviricetes sp.]
MLLITLRVLFRESDKKFSNHLRAVQKCIALFLFMELRKVEKS